MLNLSDAELANLRLECWKATISLGSMLGRKATPDEMTKATTDLLNWCLRDKPED